jgi:hypothetical protein
MYTRFQSCKALFETFLGVRTWWPEMFGTEERWQMFVVAEGQ